jgi:SAM-dependent methyltransferase
VRAKNREQERDCWSLEPQHPLSRDPPAHDPQERSIRAGCRLRRRRAHPRAGARHTERGGDRHDQPSIDEARDQIGEQPVDYLLGDFLGYPFEDESFNFIASVATLHHMDAAGALTRMGALLRPGGVVAVLGLARSSSLRDLPYELAGLVAHRAHSLTRVHWEHPSPTVWPPPETYGSMRRLAADLLPGSLFRRHMLWRYSLVWSKPDDR